MPSLAAPAPAAVRSPARLPGRFLTAQWKQLAMLSWEVPPDLLAPAVPRGLELDFHHGATFVSVVGFQFLDTRVLGVGVPGHRHFAEVNLRFYVLRRTAGETRRGVVFLQELAPRRLVNWTARLLYRENYVTVPLRGSAAGFDEAPGSLEADAGGPRVEYVWRHRRAAYRVTAAAEPGPGEPAAAGTLDEFIIEHYFGYGRRRGGGTLEYRVEHPPWRIWPAKEAEFCGDAGPLYGSQWADVLARPPDHALLADGSPVTVRWPTAVEG